MPRWSASPERVSAAAYTMSPSGARRISCGWECHRSTLGRVLAGDDARSVLHHAPCAVAIAPRGYAHASRRTATIGVAYDGSDESEVAIAHAGLLAADLDAKLIVRNVEELHVYGAGSWASATVLLEDPDTIVAGARQRLGDVGPAKLDVVVGP